MAILHSERPSENSTEARIYDLLKDGLDDEWQLWHEPEIHRKEDEERPYRPDFVLLHRQHGLFVLEVKGWTVARIKDVKKVPRGTQHVTQVLYDFHIDGEQWVDTPFDQLAKYKREIVRKLKQHNGLFGVSKKKMTNFLGGAVVLANISVEDTGDLPPKLSAVLAAPNQKVFYQPKIQAWREHGEQVEIDLADSNKKHGLSESQMDILRGIVHPESVLPLTPSKHITIHQVRPVMNLGAFILEVMRILRAKSEPTREPISDAAGELRVLSRMQERVARYEIGSGHRILFGVAGSGKTMILIARARWLAMRNPAQEILVLCFNRALSLYIAKVLEAYENIDVLTFHAWVRERLGFDLEFGSKEYGSKLLNYLRERKVDKYQAILIDECQDWRPDWFKAVLRAAADPVNGDLLIVGDGSQSIYREHGDFAWEDCGINPQPWRESDGAASITFERNYRNTPQIVALASAIARGGRVSGEDSGSGVLSLLPKPDECVRGDGPLPSLGRFSDRTREMEFVASQIHRLIVTEGSLQPCDFAVMYPGYFSVAKAKEQFGILFEKLEELSIRWDFVRGGAERNQERLIEGNTVKILNIGQMKGLEQKVCFVIGVDEYQGEKEEVLLYVAITRATDWLYLTWAGEEHTSIVRRLTADPSLYQWCETPLR